MVILNAIKLISVNGSRVKDLKEMKLQYQAKIRIIAWNDMGFIFDQAINALMRFRIRSHWVDEYTETPVRTGSIISYWNINSNAIAYPQLRITWYPLHAHHSTRSKSRDALIYAEEQFSMCYAERVQLAPFHAKIRQWKNSILQQEETL